MSDEQVRARDVLDGSAPEEELETFERLQHELLDRWLRIREVDAGPRDIVVVPSLSLDGLPMSSIGGVTHYEERMLFTLSLLRHPRAHLVYLTSGPLHPQTVDYLVALVRGIPAAHVRERLTLLSTYDASPRTLTEKILERPRLIERIRREIRPERAHMTCFTVSPLERALAVRLGIPLYGVDPKLLHLGTKSGSRKVFRAAGVAMPAGFEDVRSEDDVAEAVSALWEQNPSLSKVVVKHDHGFSGEGNAVVDLGGIAQQLPAEIPRAERTERIRDALPTMRLASDAQSYTGFVDKLSRVGGIVEEFVDGMAVRSPSAQLRINPRGDLECVSTHDQLLAGPDGQTYAGCRFPADEAYRLSIQRDSLRVGEQLLQHGVVGRIAVDFIAGARPGGGWNHYAIEINLRMSGTTHPMMLMRMLNAGDYDPQTGLYRTRRGDVRYYTCTDGLSSPQYRGLAVEDLLDIAAVHRLHYQPWTDTGVVFHLTGAVSQFGKVGITAIGASPDEAEEWFARVRQVLDRETEPDRVGP